VTVKKFLKLLYSLSLILFIVNVPAAKCFRLLGRSRHFFQLGEFGHLHSLDIGDFFLD